MGTPHILITDRQACAHGYFEDAVEVLSQHKGHPNLSGEVDVPKRNLLLQLLGRAEQEIVAIMSELAESPDVDVSRLLGGLLDLLGDAIPVSLDQALSSALLSGAIGPSSLQRVATCALQRDTERALQACYARLTIYVDAARHHGLTAAHCTPRTGYWLPKAAPRLQDVTAH